MEKASEHYQVGYDLKIQDRFGSKKSHRQGNLPDPPQADKRNDIENKQTARQYIERYLLNGYF